MPNAYKYIFQNINILLDFRESIGAKENMKNATRTKK
jgi:hypothetical protein